MHLSLLPSMIVDSVTDLTAEFLLSKSIDLLMLDFDNTIVPYTTDIPTEKTVEWLHSINASNINLCVVSNSHNERVKKFCVAYGISCITHAKKPTPGGIRRCMNEFSVVPERCAIAGDQIFTDTLGGNLAGVRTILVKPIDNHNFWLKARHILEKPFIFIAGKRRIEQ